QQLCEHTKFFLQSLHKAHPNFGQTLVSAYDDAKSDRPKSVSTGTDYNLEELAFRVPILYEGDRGAGKTFEARNFARINRLPVVECAGHEGVEAIDMLGHFVPYGQGMLVWKDGPLSEAFRRAHKGQVVFIMDELLRIP